MKFSRRSGMLALLAAPLLKALPGKTFVPADAYALNDEAQRLKVDDVFTRYAKATPGHSNDQFYKSRPILEMLRERRAD